MMIYRGFIQVLYKCYTSRVTALAQSISQNLRVDELPLMSSVDLIVAPALLIGKELIDPVDTRADPVLVTSPGMSDRACWPVGLPITLLALPQFNRPSYR